MGSEAMFTKSNLTRTPKNQLCQGVTDISQYSAVGIVTRYKLVSLGIKSWWERDLLQPIRTALGPTYTRVQWVLGLFPSDKATGACH